MSEITPAENLRAVAGMIRDGKMWCKGEWSALRSEHDKAMSEGDSEAVGCAEGLLAQQMGYYTSRTEVRRYSAGKSRLLGHVLNFFTPEEEDEGYDEVGASYHINELRQTKEWDLLRQTIVEAEVIPDTICEENVVICWNDQENTTEGDAEMMFEKAALRAEEIV